MPKKLSDVFSKIQAAGEANDLEALEELQQAFKVRKRNADIPFAPSVSLDAKFFGQSKMSNAESSAALPLANYWSRTKRNVQYRLRKAGGYDGPVIVSEGDSWFQYPIRLDDVIDHLLDEYNIYSLGAAGDLLANMILDDEFVGPIESEQADFFLLSAIGNDMLGNGRLRDFLHNYQTGMSANDVINQQKFEGFIRSTSESFSGIFESLVSRFPRLKILCHSYDYVVPREDGKWLGIPMRSRGLPKSLWKPVIKEMIDALSGVLLQQQDSFATVNFVDCRGVVTDWYDELHPTSAHYKNVADLFQARIAELNQPQSPFSESAVIEPSASSLLATATSRKVSLGSPEFASMIQQGQHDAIGRISRESTAERLVPPAPQVTSFVEANIDFDAVLLDDLEEEAEDETNKCAELCHWQSLFDEEDLQAYRDVVELLRNFKKKDPLDQQKTRQELNARHRLQRFERIIGDSNLFEVNFLSRGQLASKSVGRVTIVNEYGIPIGTGSGFLVAPGLLLTNNHVLSGIEYASKSYVIFDYEYDAEHSMLPTERFDLTADVFVTDAEYDFTFVSVARKSRNGVELSEYGHLPMIRESGKALKGEPTSIIQHPNGLPKQIAIRDSRILGRKRQFIYYTTDTHSGSSGGPVLSDDWFPVALHHRAVPHYKQREKFIANRGIRISSIFERLDDFADADDDAAKVLEMISRRTGIAFSRGGASSRGRGSAEALQEVYHEVPYHNRDGYNNNFLGKRVDLPTINVEDDVSRLTGTDEYWIPYEHFSVVNYVPRKLALVTASNVNFDPNKQRPEDGDYRRKALTGVSGAEGWFKDPRIPLNEQLPDEFYNDDRTAFQKGHIVRRNDVTWGESYEQIRRANGDTYHLTNCSPQVPSFNQHGIWAKLENLIGREGKNEKLCVFSGPVFSRYDRLFHGTGDNGAITVKIPLRYWKVVVARNGDALESFAFVLKQSLRGVRFREFEVRDPNLVDEMISIPDLEELLNNRIKFPRSVRLADQIDTDTGRDFRELHSLSRCE